MRGKLLSLARAARALMAGAVLMAAAQSALDQAPAPEPNVFPPWQRGANNDALDRGVDFTVPQIDDLVDFHGDLSDPKLVLYVFGNYFFAMAPLVQAFETAHPDYKDASTGRRSRRGCSSSNSRRAGASPPAT